MKPLLDTSLFPVTWARGPTRNSCGADLVLSRVAAVMVMVMVPGYGYGYGQGVGYGWLWAFLPAARRRPIIFSILLSNFCVKFRWFYLTKVRYTEILVKLDSKLTFFCLVMVMVMVRGLVTRQPWC